MFFVVALYKSSNLIITIADYNHDIDPDHESVTNVVGSATLRLPRVSPSPSICQCFPPRSQILLKFVEFSTRNTFAGMTIFLNLNLAVL